MDTTELYGHQKIARKAISLARQANPDLDVAMPSFSVRQKLYAEAMRLLHSSEIRVSWTMDARHARPASANEKATAERCLDWMLLADAA